MRSRVLKVVPNLDSTAKSVMADLMGPSGFFVPNVKYGMYTHFQAFWSDGALGKPRRLWAWLIAPPMGVRGPLAVWE